MLNIKEVHGLPDLHASHPAFRCRKKKITLALWSISWTKNKYMGCWKCIALKTGGCVVVISQVQQLYPKLDCARAYVHVSRICDHLEYKAAIISKQKSSVCEYVQYRRLFPLGFIWLSDKKEPIGHAWTDLLHLYASHFLIKNNEQRG